MATPVGLRNSNRNGKFVGLVFERFEPAAVEQALCEFVSACQAPTWDEVVELLRAQMQWEHARQ